MTKYNLYAGERHCPALRSCENEPPDSRIARAAPLRTLCVPSFDAWAHPPERATERSPVSTNFPVHVGKIGWPIAAILRTAGHK